MLGYSSHLAASREEGNVPCSVPQSAPSAPHSTTLAAQPFVEQEEDEGRDAGVIPCDARSQATEKVFMFMPHPCPFIAVPFRTRYAAQ